MNSFKKLMQFHGSHNQKDHGNWADGVSDSDGWTKDYGTAENLGPSEWGGDTYRPVVKESVIEGAPDFEKGILKVSNNLSELIGSDHYQDVRDPDYFYVGAVRSGVFRTSTPPDKIKEVESKRLTEYWESERGREWKQKNHPEAYDESGRIKRDYVEKYVEENYKFEEKLEYKATLNDKQRDKLYADIDSIRKGDMSKMPAVVDAMAKLSGYVQKPTSRMFSASDIAAEKTALGKAELKMVNLIEAYKEDESHRTYHSSYNEGSIAQEKLLSGDPSGWDHAMRVIEGYTSSHEGEWNEPAFEDPTTWDRIAEAEEKMPAAIDKRKRRG